MKHLTNDEQTALCGAKDGWFARPTEETNCDACLAARHAAVEAQLTAAHDAELVKAAQLGWDAAMDMERGDCNILRKPDYSPDFLGMIKQGHIRGLRCECGYGLCVGETCPVCGPAKP